MMAANPSFLALAVAGSETHFGTTKKKSESQPLGRIYFRVFDASCSIHVAGG